MVGLRGRKAVSRATELDVRPDLFLIVIKGGDCVGGGVIDESVQTVWRGLNIGGLGADGEAIGSEAVLGGVHNLKNSRVIVADNAAVGEMGGGLKRLITTTIVVVSLTGSVTITTTAGQYDCTQKGEDQCR